jgi:hypothetical protein
MSDFALPASPPPPSGGRWRIARSAALIFSVSSIIALLFALMNNRYSYLPSELLISNAIGGCIWLLIEGIHRGSGGRVGIVTAALIGVPLGVILSAKLAALFGAYDIIGAWMHDPINESKSLAVTLLFAISASAFVILVLRASSYRLDLERERRRSAEAGRAQAIAELGLLQACRPSCDCRCVSVKCHPPLSSPTMNRGWHRTSPADSSRCGRSWRSSRSSPTALPP